MPKRKPREVSAFEKLLVEVIDKASPGRVIISKTKPFFEGHEAGYEFEIKTRASTICILGQDLEDSIHVALDELTSGEADPVRPTWNRVSRFHREVVIRTWASATTPSTTTRRCRSASTSTRSAAHVA